MAEEEIPAEDFLNFCRAHNLKPDTNDELSAARFLDYTYGRLLAWVNIPTQIKIGKTYNEIVSWVMTQDLVLCGADVPYCVNVKHPGSVPLFWTKN